MSEGLQQAGSSMIEEQIGVAFIAAQRVHRFVPADVHHLEDGSPARRSRRQEARSQRVPAEIGCLQTKPADVSLHHIGHRSVREPAAFSLQPFLTGRNSGPSTSCAASSHARTAATGQATEPDTMAMVAPCPSWS